MTTNSRSSENIADSLAFRGALRREKLAARNALDQETHLALSARIEAHLAQLLLPLPPRPLAFCAPVRGEFDARPLTARLIEQGWRGAMPVVEAPNAPMIFRAWSPASTMGTDRHGIPVPLGEPAIIPAIVLLPLLAFDSRGFRLGYGGGYFDRTLAALVPRPLAIGVGFDLARVTDIRPQAHDKPLDAMVTEAGIQRFAGGFADLSRWSPE
jgi:5,10-methenyltetrahydrofolate synthetase